ncbi:MAG: GNAT family N-acetyltransferase [Bacteroidia bacterium]|nr:GNAT family N-acetyltransferase [Bacteroidia bacterium]
MIRSYNPIDKNALISIMQELIPEYFDPSEIEAYKHYLEHEIEEYFVIEHQGKIIGGGGINYLTELLETRISWDLIHTKYQGKGFGKEILSHRIKHIKKTAPNQPIIVRTSQHTYQFYEKNGFAINQIVKDFWSPGYDLYYMTLL